MDRFMKLVPQQPDKAIAVLPNGDVQEFDLLQGLEGLKQYVEPKVHCKSTTRVDSSDRRLACQNVLDEGNGCSGGPGFCKGTVSLYSPGALLKIEIRHFDGPVFPYTLAHLVSIPHFI